MQSKTILTFFCVCVWLVYDESTEWRENQQQTPVYIFAMILLHDQAVKFVNYFYKKKEKNTKNEKETKKQISSFLSEIRSVLVNIVKWLWLYIYFCVVLWSTSNNSQRKKIKKSFTFCCRQYYFIHIYIINCMNMFKF